MGNDDLLIASLQAQNARLWAIVSKIYKDSNPQYLYEMKQDYIDSYKKGEFIKYKEIK